MPGESYSLWLMPSGQVYDTLAETIHQLSARYSTVSFEPHVTLLSHLAGSEQEIVAKGSELSTVVRPYEIRLAAPDYLDEYFRCVFLRVEETPAVVDAHRQARQIFGRRQDPPYMPHLSLVYGNLPSATKQSIVAQVGRELQLAFQVTSMHLFSTHNQPDNWRRVKEFALG